MPSNQVAGGASGKGSKSSSYDAISRYGGLAVEIANGVPVKTANQFTFTPAGYGVLAKFRLIGGQKSTASKVVQTIPSIVGTINRVLVPPDLYHASPYLRAARNIGKKR